MELARNVEAPEPGTLKWLSAQRRLYRPPSVALETSGPKWAAGGLPSCGSAPSKLTAVCALATELEAKSKPSNGDPRVASLEELVEEAQSA